MYNFDYIRPRTLNDALAALKTEGAQALSGGQTLIPSLKQRLAQPAALVDLSGLSELKGITNNDKSITIGAATRHVEVATSAVVQAEIPALAKLAGGIGDPAVRNRGTLGGSVANNDPSACYPSACLALNAQITTDRRTIDADVFFKGMFETALGDGEVIKSIRFPKPDRAAYVKFEQPASRFALVGVFVAKFGDQVRVAVTGASESGVFRWREAEKALSGNYTAAALAGIKASAEGLINDLHGTAAYRAHLIGVLTGRAVAAS